MNQATCVCDVAATKLIENDLASAHGGTCSAGNVQRFKRTNRRDVAPPASQWAGRAGDGSFDLADARPPSTTRRRTKTPRDKSGVRRDRFGIHTRQLGWSCTVASASHLVASACVRTSFTWFVGRRTRRWTSVGRAAFLPPREKDRERNR